MNILMISLDRALLGEKVSTGDVVARHKDYGQYLGKLDIIICTKKGYQTKKLADNVFCYPTNSSTKLSYLTKSLKIARQLFSGNSYDLIVCQDPFLTGLAGYLIKRKFNTKLLVHFHGDFWHNPYWLKENFLNRPLLFLSKFIVNKSDAIRVVSKGIKRKLVNSGLAASKIKVISTPVNLKTFQKADNQTVFSIKSEFSGKKIIFWAGRMAAEKNLPFLLHAFKKIITKYHEAVLLLGGSGKEFIKIQKLVVQLGLSKQVKLLGHINYSQLPNYYQAADIFVFPSLHESFGKVLLEAAASAKPAVASATTGAKEIIINNKTGWLVPINNQKQFINKTLKLLENEKLAAKMGAAAYNYVAKEFSYQKNIQEVVNYWHEIAIGLNAKKSNI